jgi:hypothetical protein
MNTSSHEVLGEAFKNCACRVRQEAWCKPRYLFDYTDKETGLTPWLIFSLQCWLKSWRISRRWRSIFLLLQQVWNDDYFV